MKAADATAADMTTADATAADVTNATDMTRASVTATAAATTMTTASQGGTSRSRPQKNDGEHQEKLEQPHWALLPAGGKEFVELFDTLQRP